MQKLIISIVMMLAILFPCVKNALGQYEGANKVRFVLAPNVSENFLRRIAAAGYNYIGLDFSPQKGDSVNVDSNWNDGVYRFLGDNSAPHAYYTSIMDGFLAVHNFNRAHRTRLQVVPIVTLASRFSTNLQYTGLAKQIKWEPIFKLDPVKLITHQIRNKAVYDNTDPLYNSWQPSPLLLKKALDYMYEQDCSSAISLDTMLKSATYANHRCPSFAPDAIGYDKVVRNIFRVIASAFKAAHDEANLTPDSITPFPDSIPYVDINHCEPYLIELAPVEVKNQFLPGQSQLDKEWIFNNCNPNGNITTTPMTRCDAYEVGPCFSLSFDTVQTVHIGLDTILDSSGGFVGTYLDTIVHTTMVAETVSCVDGYEPVTITYPLDTNNLPVIDSTSLRLPYNYSLTVGDQIKSSIGIVYYGDADTSQREALMVNELVRIIDTISRAADSPDPTFRPFRSSRFIVSADAWDKYKKAGAFHVTGAVKLLAAASPACTSRVVFQPYQYDETHRNVGTTVISDWRCTGYDISYPWWAQPNNHSSFNFAGKFQYNLKGNYYPPDSALDFFHNSGFNTMQCYSWAAPFNYSTVNQERFSNYFRMVKAAVKDTLKNIGYTAVNWMSGDDKIFPFWWDDANPLNLYNQKNYCFSILEFTSQLLNPSISHFGRLNSAQRNSTFYGNLMPVMNTPISASFLIDQYAQRRLDYFVTLKNHFYPDLDDSANITGAKRFVPFYDAILYCNKLSEKEGLEPVYTFTGVVCKDNYKNERPDVIIGSSNPVRVDFTKSGYRLPNRQELERAIADTVVATAGSSLEWIWQGTTADSTLCSSVEYFFYNHITNIVDSTPTIWPSPNPADSKAFRVVRNIPDTVIITGSNEQLQKYAIARITILMYDATFDPADNAKYYSGRDIVVRNETTIPEGAEVLMKTE